MGLEVWYYNIFSMKKILILLVTLVILFLAGSVAGFIVAKRGDVEPEITSNILAAQMQKEGFLVTQSLVLHEQVTIEKKSGNMFKDFFLGQTIDAQAVIHIDRGIDLTKIIRDDILVQADNVSVHLPEFEIRSVAIVGPITLHNDQGIIKKMFDDEDGYNEAIDLLKKQARSAADSDEFLTAAKNNTSEHIQRIFRLIGVEKNIIVTF
jgi:hypothetical protein